MKIQKFETHDRLEHFKQDQEKSIQEGIEACIKQNPLSLALQARSSYIYIFAHARTAEDGITKVLYWQPRLSKPEPATNSMLFRVHSKTDIAQICWIIPPVELWEEYKKGKMMHNEIIEWSIEQYKHRKEELGKPEQDDCTEEQYKNIMRDIIAEQSEISLRNQLYK